LWTPAIVITIILEDMSRQKIAELLFPGLAGRIREIRGFLTQKEFAQKLGVTQGAVQKYEKGINNPGYGVLEKIAAFGAVTVEWLLHGEEARAPELQDSASEAYCASLSAIETALLTEAVTMVEEVVKAERLKFSPAQKSRLIVRVYDDCRAQHLRPTHHQVRRLLLLVD
jgi:transcriptional regulator with XRE-family HTH domain